MSSRVRFQTRFPDRHFEHGDKQNRRAETRLPLCSVEPSLARDGAGRCSSSTQSVRQSGRPPNGNPIGRADLDQIHRGLSRPGRSPLRVGDAALGDFCQYHAPNPNYPRGLIGNQECPVAGDVKQRQFPAAGDGVARCLAAKIVGEAEGSAELFLPGTDWT